MFSTKTLGCLLLLSSLATACGEGSIESGPFGSACYLNDNGDNQPLLNSFNGKILAGGTASLNLGDCIDIESGLTIRSAHVDDESIFTIETSEDEIKVTSLGAGTAVLTVSRTEAEDVSFNLSAVESDHIVAVDFGQSAALVNHTSFTTSLQFFANDDFLAGGKYLMSNRLGGGGIEVNQSDLTSIKLQANELGSHTVNLESTELSVDVIEQSSAVISTMALLGDSTPINSSNMVFVDFATESGLSVKSIGELTSPSVTSSDESVCRPSFNENSLQTILVEAIGVGTCELSIHFDQFSTTHTLNFTEAVEETHTDEAQNENIHDGDLNDQ